MSGDPVSGGRSRAVYLLLLLPALGTLAPWVYNRRDPAVFGIPFFYWYQLVWIPVGVACTFAVYRATSTPRER